MAGIGVIQQVPGCMVYLLADLQKNCILVHFFTCYMWPKLHTLPSNEIWLELMVNFCDLLVGSPFLWIMSVTSYNKIPITQTQRAKLTCLSLVLYSTGCWRTSFVLGFIYIFCYKRCYNVCPKRERDVRALHCKQSSYPREDKNGLWRPFHQYGKSYTWNKL